MGRPPNPLIVEYFRRGKKLKDKSNRYEHACRKCGVLDKTGRPEKLIDHLVKCSQLDYDQRQEILARHLNQRSGVRNCAEGVSSRRATPPGYAGLEGLAEAARRLLPSPARLQQNSPGKGLYNTQEPDMPSIQDTASSDVYNNYAIVDDLDDEGRGQNTSNITSSPVTPDAIRPPIHSSASLPVPASSPGLTSLPVTVSRVSLPPVSLPFQLPIPTQLATTTQAPMPSQPCPAMSSHDTSTALAIPGPAPLATPTLSDAPPQLPSPSSAPDTFHSGVDAATADFPPTSEIVVADSEKSPKSNRPKRTSKLQPQQREKTARMRRQGACIRCRLLKKPCSGDDPCQQCQILDNPRTWRHPCQRVKLHEEVSIYSAGLQHALVQQQLQDLAASHALIEDPTEAFIRVSIGSHESRLSFKALRYQPKDESSVAGHGEVFIIDTITKYLIQMESKMKRYLVEERSALLETEQSPILRSTLRLAKRIFLDQNDEILSSTLELWVATLLLTDYSERIEISLELHRASNMEQIDITKQSHKQSYEVIRGQLLSAVETNVAAHLQKLLVRLEARLQKPKGCLFETFLACLLLLNCAERMCWLIRHWQIPELGVQPWPLQKEQPGELLQQGETMASVLHMIMDMRNVLPRPHTTKEGRLIAPSNASEDVRTWFNEVDLSIQELKIMEGRPFVAGDLRSMDGRFWARILSVDD